ncbi:DUF4197 domain-containing protein [Sphingomonas mucosissima]|uniref:DUF4197 domain-containing protein n=1 Tax=Sphingomonas mucosissima TaxID=370959 RepID=A0A245ZFU9_9SPHN|nr:DUF4197 domain-containing protein [Sphingomonas mucosissima]OWK28621.1 hypothetical protein SPMU_28830 [Sphingomonas mucosissima]
MINPTRRSLLLGAGFAVPLLLLPACATTGFDGGVTEGLRRLLAISSERALTRLIADNGFLNDPDARITFPAQPGDRTTAVLGALLGSAPVQRQLALAINRAAGEAADRAAPLIYDSIRSLTFSDALGIVRGGPTAATAYLERSIGDRIIDAMLPEVGGALRQFDGNSILGPVLGAATGINVAGIQRTVTDQAARGLWRAIGREEAAIRAAPASARDPLVEAVLNGSRLVG